MAGPEDEIGASCPSGSKFYVCEQTDSRFVGCCTLNPCNSDGVCASENLRPASFDKSKYDKVMPQACATPNVQKWYTCSDLTPPFMGCCKEDPCILVAGCPTDSLGTAVLSSDKENAQVFLGGAYKTATPTENAAPTTSASLTASSTADSTVSSSGLSKSAVGGIAAGASIGGLLLLATMIFFFMRKRKRKSWRNEGGTTGAGYEPYVSSTQQYRESKLSSSPYSPDFSPYNYQAATFDQIPAQIRAQSPSPPNMFPTPQQGNSSTPKQCYKPSERASWTCPPAQLQRDSLFVGELPA